MIPRNIPMSPTLLTKNAFFAAFPALFFSYQKPISRNELKPTSSQNTKVKNKLLDKTIPFIEKVNRPRYA